MKNVAKLVDTLESIEYNLTLALGTIKRRSKEKLYNEHGLEYLRDRRWMQRLCLFHKILNLLLPKFVYYIIPPVARFFVTRNNANSTRQSIL